MRARLIRWTSSNQHAAAITPMQHATPEDLKQGPLPVARATVMRTELIPAADVRISDCVLDEDGAPAVVTSTRRQRVGGGVASIALSDHPDRRASRTPSTPHTDAVRPT